MNTEQIKISNASKILRFGFLFLLVLVLIFFSGFYPVALVGRQIILASDFYSNLEAAKKFYESQKINEESNKINWKSKESNILEVDIKTAVFQNLIEDRILINESNQIPDLKKRVNENLAEIISQVSNDLTNEGLANLYGWDIRTFKKRVLEPEARRKVFFEGFARQGKDFNSWFNEAKYSADVKILLPSFYWDSSRGRVQIRK